MRAAPTTKAVAGGVPCQLLKAALERFRTSVLVPALGFSGSGSMALLCPPSSCSRCAWPPSATGAMLGELIASFCATTRQRRDPWEGASHLLWARADRSRSERWGRRVAAIAHCCTSVPPTPGENIPCDQKRVRARGPPSGCSSVAAADVVVRSVITAVAERGMWRADRNGTALKSAEARCVGSGGHSPSRGEGRGSL